MGGKRIDAPEGFGKDIEAAAKSKKKPPKKAPVKPVKKTPAKKVKKPAAKPKK